MLHRPYGPRGAESEDPEFWTDLTRNSDFLPEPGIVNPVLRSAQEPDVYKRQAQITAGDILRAVEGEIVPVPCLATSAESCPHRAQCETLGFWEGLNQVINQYIDSATLEKLSSEYLSH